MEDMNFDDVCTSLYEMIGEHEQYLNDITNLVKKYQSKFNEQGRNVFTSTTYHKRVRHFKHTIVAWFTILPVYLITRLGGIVVEIYMRCIGYRCYKFKNRLKIWYNKYDQTKGNPLIFFHASVGGVTIQVASLDYFSKHHNIIMPEIPGVSFIDTYDKPPLISEIIENVHEFVLNHYVTRCERSINSSDIKINLMGHSLGCTVCSAYINRYPRHIDNFFCVEGQIFFPRAIRLSEDFVMNIEDIPTEDWITVPLFHRDLYVQYFMIKCITLDATMIFDLTNDDNKHIKIHMYHIKNDRRILIRPQLEYAIRKKIKITHHLFDGDFSHGSFAFNKKVRKYIMNNIREIYDECKIKTIIQN
jgi:pimeloyl-ACP methyl ester carboxylesterase